MNQPIYLDYNATTPHAPEIIEAMRPFLEEHFGNPSSSHWYGMEPRRAVEKARVQVAGLLQCSPKEVFFTSGGTESNNHAIKGMAWAMRDRLFDKFAGNIADVQRNGHPERSFPNTLSVSFKGIEADKILEKIAHTVAASAGAACHSGTVRISHVLKAMGVHEGWAKGTLRFSVGRMTTMEQIDRAAEAVIAAVREMTR